MATAVRALGEVALRVRDLEAMTAFYRDVIGLELLGAFKTSTFFALAPGHQGHTQSLVLFDRSSSQDARPERRTSALDHLALTIDLADFESEVRRLQSLGQDVTTTEHDWVQWRSLYVDDPEGNTVELVCFDPSIPLPDSRSTGGVS